MRSAAGRARVEIAPGVQPTVGSTAPPSTPMLPTTAPATAITAVPPATETPAPATSVPAPPITDAQPAADPLDAARRFVAALQADRSGRLAANYAGDELATVLRSGTADVGGLLGEQNPFTGFSVDGIVGSAPPFSYVRVTFAYGSTPQPASTRVLDVEQQGGLFVVTAIGPSSPIPLDRARILRLSSS